MGVTKPRKPFNVLVLSGRVKDEPGRYADRENSPKPDEGIGDPPAMMSEPVREIWFELVGLCPAGVLTKMDRPAFEALCNLLFFCRSQFWMVRPDVYGQLKAYMSLFGMTPSDRTRVVVPQKQEKNPYEGMTRGASSSA